MSFMFKKYSWSLGAPYFAFMCIHMTLKVQISLITHYEVANKLVFNYQNIIWQLWFIALFKSFHHLFPKFYKVISMRHCTNLKLIAPVTRN